MAFVPVARLYQKLIGSFNPCWVGCGFIFIELNTFLFIVTNGYIKKIPKNILIDTIIIILKCWRNRKKLYIGEIKFDVSSTCF